MAGQAATKEVDGGRESTNFMKILQKGKVKNIHYFAHCDSCGCKAELTEEEYEKIPVIDGYYGTKNRNIPCVTENCGQTMRVYHQIY
jgi:hypothetical protein